MFAAKRIQYSTDSTISLLTLSIFIPSQKKFAHINIFTKQYLTSFCDFYPKHLTTENKRRTDNKLTGYEVAFTF